MSQTLSYYENLPAGCYRSEGESVLRSADVLKSTYGFRSVTVDSELVWTGDDIVANTHEALDNLARVLQVAPALLAGSLRLSLGIVPQPRHRMGVMIAMERKIEVSPDSCAMTIWHEWFHALDFESDHFATEARSGNPLADALNNIVYPERHTNADEAVQELVMLSERLAEYGCKRLTTKMACRIVAGDVSEMKAVEAICGKKRYQSLECEAIQAAWALCRGFYKGAASRKKRLSVWRRALRSSPSSGYLCRRTEMAARLFQVSVSLRLGQPVPLMNDLPWGHDLDRAASFVDVAGVFLREKFGLPTPSHRAIVLAGSAVQSERPGDIPAGPAEQKIKEARTRRRRTRPRASRPIQEKRRKLIGVMADATRTKAEKEMAASHIMTLEERFTFPETNAEELRESLFDNARIIPGYEVTPLIKVSNQETHLMRVVAHLVKAAQGVDCIWRQERFQDLVLCVAGDDSQNQVAASATRLLEQTRRATQHYLGKKADVIRRFGLAFISGFGDGLSDETSSGARPAIREQRIKTKAKPKSNSCDLHPYDVGAMAGVRILRGEKVSEVFSWLEHAGANIRSSRKPLPPRRRRRPIRKANQRNPPP